MKYIKNMLTLSKKNTFLFFAIPIILVIIHNLSINNDIWFLLNHGKYVLTNGFPTIEPFTIHENLSFVMQQWGSGVIFYQLFSGFGKYALFFLPLVMSIYMLFISYKTCMLLSDHRYQLSTYISCLVVAFLSHFIVARPQVFSIAILMTELYVLEKYWKEKSWKPLLILPVLSFLLINLHASMWWMQFVLMLPYLVESVYQDYKKHTFHTKHFLFLLPIQFLVGFLNPYTIDAITYVFTSYGVDEINNVVGEMQVPNIQHPNGLYVFLSIAIVYLSYMFYHKEKMTLRHFFLTLGTTFLALSSYKGQCYFLIASYFPLAYYFRNSFLPANKLKQPTITTLHRNVYIICCIVLFTLPLTVICMNNQVSMKSEVEGCTNYLLEHSSIAKEDIILYIDYNNGGYTEYRGIKSYIDPRAEVFLKANNHEKDIMKEYNRLQRGDLFYEDFMNTYHFTHLLVAKGDFLYPYLERDSNYTKIYEEEINDKTSYAVFARSDLSQI